MLSQLFENLIIRECRATMQILPFLGLAILCALIVGPALSPTASSSFASPLSPVSPISLTPTATVGPEKVLPPSTARAQKTDPPTVTATVAIDVPEQPPRPVPPSLSPSDLKEEPTTPPTLWVVAGLVIVGGIVAGLIVFKKS